MKFKNNYALYREQDIDLHNNFDLVDFNFSIADRTVKLTWTKSKGSWVAEKEFLKLILIHSDVFFLNIGYDNKDYEYPSDDKCLAGISFNPSSERQTNEEFTMQNTPAENDDIVYFFETDHFIRIGCSKVELVAE